VTTAAYSSDNAGDRVFLVAWVNALRRVADEKIFLPFLARRALKFGDADFFGGTWVDGGFIDHNRAGFQIGCDGTAGTNEWAKVGQPSLVDWRGNGDDDAICCGEISRIGGDL
jgi:hypothetical protein